MGRKLSKTDVESDRIGSLPDHLKEQILSNLSIKEAVRTSVLSSNWRKKWSTQPDLVFDSRCVSTATSQNPSVIESKFLRITDHVLLLHSGSINKFEVSGSCYDNNITIRRKSLADVDRWIHHLAGRSVKEFVLTIRARLEEQTDLLTAISGCTEDIFSGPTIPLRVRCVMIEDISGTESELDFIRFLLLYSPVLEKMYVKSAENVEPELMTELIRFCNRVGTS